MSLFNIRNVGLDLTTLDYTPDHSEDYDCFYTSITSGNDFLLRPILDTCLKASIITEVPYLDDLTRGMLKDHWKTIGRENSDTILVSDLGKSDPDVIKDMAINSTIGLVDPKDYLEITKLYEILGELPKVVALPICPLNFNYTLISELQTAGIKIIGMNPMGGYINAARTIQAFSVPYLLGLISTYATTVILSGRDLFASGRSRDYLRELRGRESEGIYKLDYNVSGLIEPLSQVVSTSLKLDEIMRLPYESPGLLYTPSEVSLTLSGMSEQFVFTGLLDPELSEILDALDYPGIPELDFNIARYRCQDYLLNRYPESEGWTLKFAPLGGRIIGLMLSRETKDGWLFKKTQSDNQGYFLALPKGGKPIILNDRNTGTKA